MLWAFYALFSILRSSSRVRLIHEPGFYNYMPYFLKRPVPGFYPTSHRGQRIEEDRLCSCFAGFEEEDDFVIAFTATETGSNPVIGEGA